MSQNTYVYNALVKCSIVSFSTREKRDGKIFFFVLDYLGKTWQLVILNFLSPMTSFCYLPGNSSYLILLFRIKYRTKHKWDNCKWGCCFQAVEKLNKVLLQQVQQLQLWICYRPVKSGSQLHKCGSQPNPFVSCSMSNLEIEITTESAEMELTKISHFSWFFVLFCFLFPFWTTLKILSYPEKDLYFC